MAVKSDGFTNQEGTVDIRAPGGVYKWAGACVAAGAATVPLGTVTRSKCRHPTKTYDFETFNKFKAAPDDISFDLMMPKAKTMALNRMIRTCPHDIRKRWSNCLNPSNIESWQFIEDFIEVDAESITDSGGTIEIDGSGADVLETAAMKSLCVDYLWRPIPTRIGEAVTTLDINAVRFCSDASCGECGAVSDGCTVFAAVTDSDLNYLDTPKLIVAERDLDNWAFTYTVWDIDPFNAGGEHAVDLACLSDGRYIVISSVAGALAYSDTGGDTWTDVALDSAPNAIFAQTWANIVVVGDGGYIWVSRDGGTTWTAVEEGGETTENLLDVHGYGDTMIAVGENNTVLISRDGGDTWDTVAGPAAGDNLNVCRAFGENELLVGTDAGEIYRTIDTGANWEEEFDFTDALGAAASVDAWDFCGCKADKGFIIVNSGGTAVIYRTIDHAYSFRRLKDDQGTKVYLPDNDEVNDIACCDPNIAVAVGEVNAASGWMALIK